MLLGIFRQLQIDTLRPIPTLNITNVDNIVKDNDSIMVQKIQKSKKGCSILEHPLLLFDFGTFCAYGSTSVSTKYVG